MDVVCVIDGFVTDRFGTGVFLSEIDTGSSRTFGLPFAP